MTTRSTAVAVFAPLMVAISLASVGAPPQPPAPELLAKARERVLDRSKAGPITLRYALHFPDGRKGTYVLIQRNQENWREDIQVGALAVAEGTTDGNRWRSSGNEALELRWLVDTLLDLKRRLEADAGAAFIVSHKRINGGDYLEVRTRAERGPGDWAALLDLPALDLRVSESAFERLAYADWKELPGAGRFPGVCRISLQDDVVLDMVLASATNKRVNDTEIAAPADAVELPGCAAEDGPKLVRRTSPTYPEAARLDRAQGLVVVSGVIQTNGSVTGLRLVHAPKARKQSQTMLVEAAIAAVSSWRYEPARCHGMPVPAVLDVAVTFTLR